MVKNELGSRQRELGDYPYPIFQIESPANSITELYFHIKTESLYHFPMRVSQESDFFVHSYKKSLAYGVFIGIQVFALLIGLINFFIYKHRNFGWYSCMVFFGALTPLYSNGYFTVIFPIHFGILDNRLIILISTLYIFFSKTHSVSIL